MQRIQAILQKLHQLSGQSSPHMLDIDLMIDCTKDLYLELLDQRLVLQSETKDLPPIIQEPVRLNTDMTIAASPLHSAIETPQQEQDEREIAPAQKTESTVNIPLELLPVEHKPLLMGDVDIRSLIGINDKYQYISELFRNDRDAYEDMLNEINSFETEEQTLEWLNFSIADAYDWNEDSDAVQMFYRLLHDFFLRR